MKDDFDVWAWIRENLDAYDRMAREAREMRAAIERRALWLVANS